VLGRSIAVVPAISLLIGGLAVLNEAETYDMPGFGLLVGGAVAVISMWLVGGLLPQTRQHRDGRQ
jgi:hypothetical protein